MKLRLNNSRHIKIAKIKTIQFHRYSNMVLNMAGWTQTKEEGLSSKGTNGSLRILSKFNS